MPATLPISVLDVFAERPLAGNQLAVVHEAAQLSAGQMQAIALEMNFSETTFVTAQGEGRAAVRIFTPINELPFAGHPTIGTAWELTGGEGDITLDLAVGPVQVRFEQGIGWMQPPEVSFQGDLSKPQAAALVGLTEDQLAVDLPASMANVGPQFVLIPVRDRTALQAVQVDAQVRRQRGELGNVVLEQGFEINRPSRLYLQIGAQLRVGGKVQPVLRGSLTNP